MIGEWGRRAGARRRRPDAGREVVSRYEAQLRREPAPAPRRCARYRVPWRGPRPAFAELSRAPRRGVRACPGIARGRGGARAIASPAICPTCPRRSSRCSPPRASARPGLPPLRTSACKGVVDRFGQIAPKVLFSADGYFYDGKRFDSIGRLAPDRGADSVDRTHRGGAVHHRSAPDVARGGQGRHARWSSWPAGFPRGNRLRAPPVRPPALHHVLVGYDRGAPKCIVHGAGGTLLQHIKELALHSDVKRGEADPLLHDLRLDDVELAGERAGPRGDPRALRRFPVPSRRQRAIRLRGRGGDRDVRHLRQVHRRGQEGGPRPGEDPRPLEAQGDPLHRLAARSRELRLRLRVHQARPLPLLDQRWHRHHVSCFVLGNPTAVPVHRGEIQCLGLGLDVHAFDDEGRSVVGEKGELVCTRAFPSMPVGFWNDPDGRKYHDAYFARSSTTSGATATTWRSPSEAE